MEKTVIVVVNIDTEGHLSVKGRPEYLSTWEAVDNSLKDVFSDNHRDKLKDSFGGSLIYSWFMLDWVGFKTNPIKRDAGYHKVHNHYMDTWGKEIKKYNDGVFLHYHHPAEDGIGDHWNMDWLSNNEYDKVLSRMILERHMFPSVYRAGGTMETNEASLWLEKWIPFDYSNRSSKTIDWNRQETEDLILKDICDWSKAPDDWSFYNPSKEDYQKQGEMKRTIFRSLDIYSDSKELREEEIELAFKKAQQEGIVLLSVFDHDYRTLTPRIETFFLDKLKRVSEKYPDVKFRYMDALEAARTVLDLSPTKLEINARFKDKDILIESNTPLFGKMPYICMKFKNKDIKHIEEEVIILDKDRWLIKDKDIKDIELLGIASNNHDGSSLVKVFEINPAKQELIASKNKMKQRFENWTSPEIENGKLTKWNWIVQNKEGLKLGEKTDIGAFTYINAKHGVEIQDNVEIGSHSSVYSESTIDGKKGKVILKKNCKIGSHSVVMPGVTVGENSIIGAFSFVNKDIPDNVMAFGTPAKVIKKLNDD